MGQWLGPYSCLRGFQASLLTTLQFLLSQTTYFVGLCIIKTWAKLIHLKSVKVYIQTLHLHISSIASSAYIHTGVMVYIWEDIGMSRGHCFVHMLRSVQIYQWALSSTVDELHQLCPTFTCLLDCMDHTVSFEFACRASILMSLLAQHSASQQWLVSSTLLKDGISK